MVLKITKNVQSVLAKSTRVAKSPRVIVHFWDWEKRRLEEAEVFGGSVVSWEVLRVAPPLRGGFVSPGPPLQGCVEGVSACAFFQCGTSL